MEVKQVPMDYLIMPGGKIPVPAWYPKTPTMSLPGRRADRIRFDPPA